MLTLPQKIQCGYFDSSYFGDLVQTPNRVAQTYEIEFYLDDGLEGTVDERTFRIYKNHIQVVRPGQIRSTQLPFRTAYLKFPASGELASLLESAPEYFCSSHPEKLLSLLEEIMRLQENEKTLLLGSRLLSFLDLLLADGQLVTKKRKENYPIVESAKAFMRQNLRQPICLKDIAAHVHLSEVYFHTLFKEAQGITPHGYLIGCRIEKAKQLLWDTSVSISDIAEETGFGCQQYLCKAFKKETGMTPAAYRRYCQNKYLQQGTS